MHAGKLKKLTDIRSKTLLLLKSLIYKMMPLNTSAGINIQFAERVALQFLKHEKI